MNTPNPKTIVIVDDEPSICEILCESFSENGYQCLTAHNGRAALELIESSQPDLIISDYQMPGLNGMELLRFTRDLSLTTPIIWVTAHASPEMFREAWRLGIYDFFEKPFKIGQVVEMGIEALKLSPEELILHRPKFLNQGFFEEVRIELDKESFQKIRKHCLGASVSISRYLAELVQADLKKAA